MPPTLLEPGIRRLELLGDPEFDPYRVALDRAGALVATRALLDAPLGEDLKGCWVVAQLPGWRSLAEEIRGAFGGRLWFDCMDDFAAFADHADLGEEEIGLARAADLVTATSQSLRHRIEPLSRRFRLVGNGCDPQHFGAALARRDPTAWPVLGFFGGIHDWFDAALVAEMARRRSAWQIWLVGDTYLGEVDCLRGLANVHLIGEVEYAELPGLVSQFDVGIIPFKLNRLTEAADPVKVYEMLAAGLPVVSVDLPEVRRLQPHVAIAKGIDDFVAAVEAALRSRRELRRERFDLAQEESWIERYLVICRAMDEVDPPPPLSAVARPLPRLAPPGRFSPRQSSLLEAENARCGEEARRLHAQAESLIEQREAVALEGARLGGELIRVETERVELQRRLAVVESRLAAVESSRWWRFGEPVRAWLRRLRPSSRSSSEPPPDHL